MKNETFTPERIKAEADAFFEWDGEDRSLVTTTSCLLFAQHIAGLMQARAAQPAPVVPVYLYRRKGLDSWATCDEERYEELAAHSLFDVKVCYDAPQPAPALGYCEYCDGTGDVHGLDGEWRGSCHCPAGTAPAQGQQVGFQVHASESAEILRNMIDSIEKHGNYSQESTLLFLNQAHGLLACATAAPTKGGDV